jgi:outer membrane protein OmpA-like peptidoglycan-associated protein
MHFTIPIHRTISRLFIALSLLALVQVGSPTASASEASPNGANIAFDFTWDDATSPPGHAASFLEVDGTSANNCSGGALTATTRTCNFVFDYRINGALQKSTTHAARWIRWANVTSYAGGKPVGNTGCSSPTRQTGTLPKAPLTLFDCFNASSFGQVFRPGTTGALTQFRMSMSCLAPSGVPKFELYALLYEMTADGSSIAGSAPLGATLVNLSKCPVSSSWNGQTFSSKNFRSIPMTFGSAQVTAGRFYAIYLTGPGVPGTPSPGAAAAMAIAKNSSTTTTTTTTTTTIAPTTTTPWSSFRGNARSTTEGTPATTFSTTVVSPTQVVMTALRLMTPAQARTFFINPLTPKVCLGSGTNLAFISKGRCTIQILRRSNGNLVASRTTRVVDGVAEPNDIVVALQPPTVVYFDGGTARVKSSSKTAINALVPTARTANSLIVAGHSGNMRGESSDLVVLSQKRANAVRSLLRGRGVNQTVAIWSFGATSPVTNSKSDAKQDLNRRAEIYLIP